MAYVKPQFLVQDMPLTFQMVNVVQDSLFDGWLQFAKWHGTVEPLVNSFGIGGVSAPPGLTYGSHNDKRIPRASARIFASSLSSGFVSSPSVVTSTPGVFAGALRQQVGVIDVRVNLTEYYADCTPFGVGLSGNLRFVIPTSLYPNQGATGALRFELFERNATSGAFEPADFDFVAHIYGSP
jgi:hypothetical protein